METSLAREGARRAVKGRRFTERDTILIAMEFFGARHNIWSGPIMTAESDRDASNIPSTYFSLIFEVQFRSGRINPNVGWGIWSGPGMDACMLRPSCEYH